MTNQSVFIPSLLGNRMAQHIHFQDEGLMIERATSQSRNLFLPWQNITGIRIKAQKIKGLYCAIGEQYNIQLKTEDNAVHTIKLNSLYGIKKKLYRQLWTKIFNLLFDYHLNHILSYYIELYNIGQLFTVAGIHIDAAGISWDDQPVLRWNEVTLNTYTYYVVVGHKYHTEPQKFLYYGEDWNAYLLQYLLTHILSTKPGAIRKNSTQE